MKFIYINGEIYYIDEQTSKKNYLTINEQQATDVISNQIQKGVMSIRKILEEVLRKQSGGRQIITYTNKAYFFDECPAFKQLIMNNPEYIKKRQQNSERALHIREIRNAQKMAERDYDKVKAYCDSRRIGNKRFLSEK